MDRRILKTQNSVLNAVLDLFVEKPSDKITVLEICKRANINKSTFYLHFKDIEDCFEFCFQTITDNIVEASQAIIYEEVRHNPSQVVELLLNEVEKKLDYLCKFNASEISGTAVKHLKASLVDSIVKSNDFTIEENYYEIISISFAVGGCTDAIISQLPAFDRQELSRVLFNMLSSRTLLVSNAS